MFLQTFWRALAAFLAAFLATWLVLHLLVATARASEVTIPAAANQYKSLLIRAAHCEMGLSSPSALFAAQIHVESRWRADAQSPVGALGLSQFMPATARWLPDVAPHTGEPAPLNPGWSIRALAAYDHWLYRQITSAAGESQRWAMTMSA